MAKQNQKCMCREPRPMVWATIKCKARRSFDGQIEPILDTVRFDSIIKCETCKGLVEVNDCSFGICREIVHRVCASCVLRDGDVEFPADDNHCSRSPITGGPEYVAVTGRYV